MLGSIPQQKFCFYHLPTRGRVGIKLGDANTSRCYVKIVAKIFNGECCLTCSSHIIFFVAITFGLLYDSKKQSSFDMKISILKHVNKQLCVFRISMLKQVIPSPLCSIIDPFVKHTRILAAPNAQVRSQCPLVGAL